MRLHCNHLREASLLPSLRSTTRREILRRLDLGVDFMQTRFRDRVRLADIAQAAHLSPFYFLRMFKSVHGITPNTYINRKRAAAALRMLQDTPWTMAMIAEHVGFESRSNLFRQLRTFYGVEPRELRSKRREKRQGRGSAGANLGITPLEMMNNRPE
jgi:AraC family transcriptional regulator